MSLTDPRMSPLFIEEWAQKPKPAQAQVIEDLKPVPALTSGESFQIGPTGEFIRLKPGDIVPAVPIKTIK